MPPITTRSWFSSDAACAKALGDSALSAMACVREREGERGREGEGEGEGERERGREGEKQRGREGEDAKRI